MEKMLMKMMLMPSHEDEVIGERGEVGVGVRVEVGVGVVIRVMTE